MCLRHATRIGDSLHLYILVELKSIFKRLSSQTVIRPEVEHLSQCTFGVEHTDEHDEYMTSLNSELETAIN